MLDEVDILSWLDETEPQVSANVTSARTDTLVRDTSSGLCFEMRREVLLGMLEKAILLVPTKDIVPVLTNFELVATSQQLIVNASSLDSSMTITTDEVEVKQSGKELFPARTLLNIVKEASPGSTIYIERTSQGAVIVAGSYSAEIRIMNSKDFPKLDSIDAIKFHSVDRSSFISAISTVKYALPGKDFSGQASLRMISVKAGKFTACDGSRFQQVRIPEFRLSLQIPMNAISALLKLLGSRDVELLNIGETTNRLIFRFSNIVLYFNKLHEPYPNVEQLWLRPALTNDQKLVVKRDDLIVAIKQVRIATDVDSNVIVLNLDANNLTIEARNVNNSATVQVPCSWDGKPRVLAFNYLHLAEMLKVYPEKECIFLLGEDSKTRKAPLLLKDETTQAISTISQMIVPRTTRG